MDMILLYGGSAILVVAFTFAAFINRPIRPAKLKIVKRILAAIFVGSIAITVGSILNTSAGTASKAVGVVASVSCLVMCVVAMVVVRKRENGLSAARACEQAT